MICKIRWSHSAALLICLQLIVYLSGILFCHPAYSAEATNHILHITALTGWESVLPGDRVKETITVTNSSNKNVASNIRIICLYPKGLNYEKNSIVIAGANGNEPLISENAQTLMFKIGALEPNKSATLKFNIHIDKAISANSVIRYISAISNGGGSSNLLKDEINLKPLPSLTSPIQAEVIPSHAAPSVQSIETSQQPSQSIKKELPEKPHTISNDTETGFNKPDKVEPESANKPAEIPVTQPSTKPLADPVLTTPANKPEAVNQKENFISGRFTAPKTESLSGLTGKTEITVNMGSNNPFLKSLDENSTIASESTKHIDTTTLVESVQIGRSFNRETLAAQSRVEQSNAQTGQALSLLLPSVSVRANYGTELSDPSVVVDSNGNPKSSEFHSRTDAALTVRQPLFDLPNFLDWQRRKTVEKSRGESYRVSDGDTYLSVVNAYLTMVSSRLQADLTRDFETQLTELHTYIEKRAKAGAATVSDMSRVLARSQATRSSLLELEAANAAAGIEFVRLTNLVVDKIRVPELQDFHINHLPNSLDLAVTTAMQQNPDLTALKHDIQAAEIETKSTKGRYFPRLDAEYTENYSLHAGGDTSSAGQRDTRVMLVLNWNLFSGGGDYKAAIERTARQKEISYRFDDQRRRVVQSLSANYATLSATRERITSGYNELKSITTAAEAMSKRMLSGNQSLLDLLDVYDRYYQVRSRLVTLHILEMSTLAQLVRLTTGIPATSTAQSTEKGGF